MDKSTNKKNMFSTLEEYEAKVSEKIADKVSLFSKIMIDNDINHKLLYVNEKLTGEDEVIVDKNTEDMIKEIKKSDIILNLIKNNIKLHNELKDERKIKRPKHYYYCKENGSNLAVSNFKNFFNQNYISLTANKNIFFSKKGEVSLIKDIFIKTLKEQIKKKFNIVFMDNENNKPSSLEINVETTNNLQNGNKKYLNREEVKEIISKSIERLYPKPKFRGDIFDDQFYVDKINEYNLNGHLQKKLNIDDIIDDMKIERKKPYDDNLKLKIKLSENVFKNYLNKKEKMKNLRKIEKKNKLQAQSDLLKRGDLIFNDKNILITRSKFYLRVDRNKMEDLRLFGHAENNENDNKKNVNQNKDENNEEDNEENEEENEEDNEEENEDKNEENLLYLYLIFIKILFFILF